VFDINLIER